MNYFWYNKFIKKTRDIVKDDYATAIVMAIRQATWFITMISRNSMYSEHVLNEIDVAFKQLKNDKKLIPIRLDEEELAPAFEYYLSRFQWMEFLEPYEDKCLNRVIKKILGD